MTTTKTYEVIQSNRIELIASANRCVEVLGFRQCIEYKATEYSTEELETYNTALAFLTEQFKQGYKTSSVELVGVTVETPEKDTGT